MGYWKGPTFNLPDSRRYPKIRSSNVGSNSMGHHEVSKAASARPTATHLRQTQTAEELAPFHFYLVVRRERFGFWKTMKNQWYICSSNIFFLPRGLGCSLRFAPPPNEWWFPVVSPWSSHFPRLENPAMRLQDIRTSDSVDYGTMSAVTIQFNVIVIIYAHMRCHTKATFVYICTEMCMCFTCMQCTNKIK